MVAGYLGSKTPVEERDSLSTPQWLYDWANEIWDFDIDLAASKGNAKCKLYVDEKENSLTRDWFIPGYVTSGWCNPPYSDIIPWITKAIEEAKNGFTTVMLMPTPNGEKKYKDIFRFASKIIFIEGRISFIGADGKPKQGNNRGSCFIVFDKYSASNGSVMPSIDYVFAKEMKINV